MKTKLSEQETIEADNLLEEASAIFSGCTNCGRCKSVCPVFKVLKKEEVSPRGIGIIITEKLMETVVKECTLCKACEFKCHMNVKVCDAVLKAREALALKKRGMKTDEKMIRDIKNGLNMFDKGKKE